MKGVVSQNSGLLKRLFMKTDVDQNNVS